MNLIKILIGAALILLAVFALVEVAGVIRIDLP